MPIEQLRLENFRNLGQLSLDFSPGFNYVVGLNGAGKTSILEAIHLLSHGRSFRCSTPGSVVQGGKARAQVRAQVQWKDRGYQLGWQRENETTRATVDLQRARMVELAQRLPHAHIDTDTHRLLSSGSAHRRQWMDWALFHVEPSYGEVWRQYHQALRQRNAWLKEQREHRGYQGHRDTSPDQDPWSALLVERGLQLDGFRRAYMDSISPYIERMSENVAGDVARDVARDVRNMGRTGEIGDTGEEKLVSLYKPGWPESNSSPSSPSSNSRNLAEALREGFSKDMQRGYTGVGPHRADWIWQRAGGHLFQSLSQGQQKTAAIVVKLAQISHLQEVTGETVLVTLDDICAELDQRNRNNVCVLLRDMGVQCLLTGILHRDLEELVKEFGGPVVDIADLLEPGRAGAGAGPVREITGEVTGEVAGEPVGKTEGEITREERV